MTTYVAFYKGKENILFNLIKFLKARVQIHDINMTKWAAKAFFISGAPRPNLCTEIICGINFHLLSRDFQNS